MRFKYEDCKCGQVHFIFVRASGSLPPVVIDFVCPVLDQMFTGMNIGRQKNAIQHVDNPEEGDIIATIPD